MSSKSIPTIPTETWQLTLDSLDFQADELGPDFTSAFVELGNDPDGETPIRFALIRYQPASTDAQAFASRPAIFFVHGMTDYFFHSHVAAYFHEQGFAVYGVDLRKCGRAWREGQTWHHVTNQAFYDTDLSLVLNLLHQTHPRVYASGHSTGGLDVTMWAARLRIENPQLHAALAGVVLNSPWLGLQFDPVTTFIARKIFPTLARIAPRIPLPGGINPAYGVSLHASQRGEWDYNLELKPLSPRPKYITWLVGVVEQIEHLQSGQFDTGVPTLLLCSDRFDAKTRYNPASTTSDVILKPAQMRENAENVHRGTTVITIPGAMHDVFLSKERARNEALQQTATWLAAVESGSHR